MEKKIKFKIGDWIVRYEIPMGGGIFRQGLPMQVQRISQFNYHCRFKDGDTVTLCIDDVDKEFQLLGVGDKIKILNPKKGDILYVEVNDGAQGEEKYLLVFDGYDESLFGYEEDFGIISSAVFKYGSESIWDNYKTTLPIRVISEIRFATEWEKEILSSERVKYNNLKKEAAMIDALANHLSKEMNYATEVGTGDGSIKAVVYKETPKDEYEELRKIDKIYVYDRFTREITECQVDEVDGCLFCLFKYKGEKASFNARGAAVQTLGRGGFKSNDCTCLVSVDKMNFKWIKESDNYVLNDIRRDIIRKVEGAFQ